MYENQGQGVSIREGSRETAQLKVISAATRAKKARSN